MKHLKFLWCKITGHHPSQDGKTCLKCGGVKRYSKEDQLLINYIDWMDAWQEQSEKRQMEESIESLMIYQKRLNHVSTL